MYDWDLKVHPYLNTWTIMSGAFEASQKALESELDRYGATSAQLYMLLVLDHSDVPLTPGQIAAYVFREQHSVSAQLSRMWRAGLVKKTRSTSDQRVVKVKITSKGKELLEQVKAPGLGLAQAILQSCFSEKELPAFNAQLKKVRDSALQRMGKELKASPSGFRIPQTQAECGLTGK